MYDRDSGKRIISFVLAAQMLCSSAVRAVPSLPDEQDTSQAPAVTTTAPKVTLPTPAEQAEDKAPADTPTQDSGQTTPPGEGTEDNDKSDNNNNNNVSTPSSGPETEPLPLSPQEPNLSPDGENTSQQGGETGGQATPAIPGEETGEQELPQTPEDGGGQTPGAPAEDGEGQNALDTPPGETPEADAPGSPGEVATPVTPPGTGADLTQGQPPGSGTSDVQEESGGTQLSAGENMGVVPGEELPLPGEGLSTLPEVILSPEESAALPVDGMLLLDDQQGTVGDDGRIHLEGVQLVFGYRPFAVPLDNSTSSNSAEFYYQIEREAGVLSRPKNGFQVEPLPITESTTLRDVRFTQYGAASYQQIKEMLIGTRVPDRKFNTSSWKLYVDPNPRTDIQNRTNPEKVSANECCTDIFLAEDTPLKTVDAAYWNKEVSFEDIDYLVVVGDWIRSDNSLARAEVDDAATDTRRQTALYGVEGSKVSNTPLTLYADSVATKSRMELEQTAATAFDPGRTEYYLRVPAEVEAIKLDMLAAEPFAYWEDEQPKPEQYGVSVKATAPDGSTAVYNSFSHEILNKAIYEDSVYTAVNNVDHPASSQWSSSEGDYIELQPSAGSGHYYNDVVVTITAPDGNHSTDYTFHIQRLNEPRVEQKYGNTPVGMIAGDSGLTEQQKAAMTTYFDQHASVSGLSIRDGKYFKGRYYGGLEFDKDPLGLVVYLNDSFEEPGIQLRSSIGDLVDITGEQVEKSIEISTVSELTTTSIMERDTGRERTEILTPDENGLWSVGGNVIPGTYTMRYSYFDEYAGVTYNSDSDSFEAQKEHAKSFERAVTILPLPGDVDLDGSVTPMDGMALQEVKDKLGADDALSELQKLYKYRVCDVADTKGDVLGLSSTGGANGLLGDADVQALYGGFVPAWQNVSWFSLYYRPLDGYREAQQVSEAGNPSAEPHIYLRYLGKGNSPAKSAVVSQEQELAAGNVFWVGVEVVNWKPGERTKHDSLNTVSLSVLYDSRYLSPAVEQEGGYVTLEAGGAAAWRATIEHCNIGDGKPWPAGNVQMLYGDPASTRVDYDSKLPATLDKEATLRELRVMLNSTGSSGITVETTGKYLAVIPFVLNVQPSGETLEGLDLSLGSGDLSFRLAKSNIAGSHKAAAWEVNGKLPEFNIAERFAYDRTVATSATLLYLSEDGKDYQQLATGVYGDAFTFTGSFGQGVMDSASTARLREFGLSYDSVNNRISGTPVKVGTCRFEVGKNAYKIIINPAKLDIWPEDQSKYYGEENPALTFRYNKEQIKAIDRPGENGNPNGVNNPQGLFLYTGRGEELVHLSGHKTEGELITQADALTPAGTADILLSGWENECYTFVYKNSGSLEAAPADAACGQAALTIRRRPIVAASINDNPVATVRMDASVLEFDLETTSEDDNGKSFTPAFPAERVGDDYKGLPLTGTPVLEGQTLTLMYHVAFTPDEAAKGTANSFVLTQEREERTVNITTSGSLRPRLKQDETSGNYELLTPYPTTAKGAVVERLVERVQFGSETRNGLRAVVYTYGSTISFSGMVVELVYEGEPVRTTTVRYSAPESLTEYGLKTALLPTRDLDSLTWNPAAQTWDEATPLADGTTVNYNDHHGKYFCIYLVTGVGENQRVCAAVSPESLTVNKRIITLTTQEAFCYYGEDPNSAYNRGRIDYTYNPDAITEADLNGRDRNTLTGSSAELVAILGGTYTPPTAWVRNAAQTDAELIKPGADVNENYFAVLSGAAADNYSFEYTQYMTGGVRTDYGTKHYAVRARPIVVEQITMSTGTDADGQSLYFLYDDTSDNRMETVRSGEEERQPTAVGTDQPGVKDSFTASLPLDGYYPAGGSSRKTPVDAGSLTGTALFGDDRLELTYVATYDRDTNINNGNHHFQLTEAEGTLGLRDVSFSDLKLVGDSARNYVLVYATIETAGGRPRQGKTADTGLVKLRPIKSVRLVSDPEKREYVYGDGLDYSGMKLELTYETEGDNADYEAVTTLDYRIVNYLDENGIPQETNNFAQLGFGFRWVTGEGEDAAAPAFTNAEPRMVPTVAEHNGRGLEIYYIANEALRCQTASTITVNKKSLTLTAAGQRRYYGEPNGDYRFTFNPAELVTADRLLLGGAQPEGTASSMGGTALTATALSPALSALTAGRDTTYFNGFVGPEFTTTAAQGANVGSYALSLSGGSMDNYTFRFVPGAITVEKRPVAVADILSDETHPVFNIYYDDPQVEFPTSLESGQAPGPVFTLKQPNQSLELGWSGSALYPGDTLRLSVKTVFPEPGGRGTTLTDNTVRPIPNIKVTDVVLVDGGKNDNYILVNDQSEWSAWGQLDNRRITGVRVTQLPETRYLYGQAMDASRMKVELSYEGNAASEEVYLERVGHVRLYYSDSAQVSSVNGLTAAFTGDHLTIAPVEGYAHQNKYLVVQATRAQTSTQPLVVTDANGAPVQIQITPLDLPYSLTARDKSYDGTTTAEGEIALSYLYGADDVTVSAKFDFLDANVKYEDAGYTLDSAESYWTDYQCDPLRDAENWHEQRQVAAMPVLVSEITLAGADAANYTIALTEAELDALAVGAEDPTRCPVAESGKVGLTDNRSRDDRARVPFAVIERARRPALTVRPGVSVDDHTNVVRIDYDGAAGIAQVVTTSTNINAGVADEYVDEVHLEYTLELKTAGDEVRTWAGDDGSAESQDSRFFGGSAVALPQPRPLDGAAAGAYVPDREDFPTDEDMAQENFVTKGQLYRWAAEDNGFVKDTGAYPGGAEYVQPGYELYRTGRSQLPRGAAAWAGVRVAATHNYEASDFLYSVEGESGTQRAQAAAAVADSVSQARLQELLTYGADEEWPSEEYQFTPGVHAAVNTYIQQLNLFSSAEEESAREGADSDKYQVYTLEAVWFTDLLEYPEESYMNGVVRNDAPTRYRGYYWDESNKTELEFDGESGALSLRGPLSVLVTVKDGDGEREEQVTVNQGNTADIFVDSRRGGGGGILESRIEITPSSLSGNVGDEPVQLTVRFYPTNTSVQTVSWSSSDSTVATVNRKGVVTFVGEGECIITACSSAGRTATIVVTVGAGKPAVIGAVRGHFHVDYQGAYLWADEQDRVNAMSTISRGDLARLVAQFCVDTEDVPPEPAFPDLGDAPYKDAVNLLASKGIVVGSRKKYEGDRPATRAEMAAILSRMLCLELPTNPNAPHAFSDTGPEETWAWAYIDAMAREGLLYGVGRGEYLPNRPVSYGEVAAVLGRIVRRGVPDDGDTRRPTDVEREDWFYESFVKGLNVAPVQLEGKG